ncbi:response regulator [Escherichia coli]|nr:response regulator [Salmonella enterica subsp. enterica serovar Newport]EFG2885741.1 response regulator [Escherichia coli]
MGLSTAIAPELPYLRRYARALTGSQSSGDAMVAAMLEGLIEDVSLYPQASSDRVALYKLFGKLFNRVAVTLPGDAAAAWEQKAQANLANISPLPRQAFLLVSVEGFSNAEGAEILEVPEEEFGALVTEASEAISQAMATDIMIIEDEPLIAMDIEETIESLGHNVVGIARTHGEAVELFHKTRPRMILADIQLADGSSGLEAVNEILKSLPVPVIFITAFPERLLTGDRPEPTFLVTKPFIPDMIKALVSQALFFDNQAKAAA